MPILSILGSNQNLNVAGLINIHFIVHLCRYNTQLSGMGGCPFAGHQVLAPPPGQHNGNRAFAAVQHPGAAAQRWRHTWQADSAGQPNRPARPAGGNTTLYNPKSTVQSITHNQLMKLSIII